MDARLDALLAAEDFEEAEEALLAAEAALSSWLEIGEVSAGSAWLSSSAAVM